MEEYNHNYYQVEFDMHNNTFYNNNQNEYTHHENEQTNTFNKYTHLENDQANTFHNWDLAMNITDTLKTISETSPEGTSYENIQNSAIFHGQNLDQANLDNMLCKQNEFDFSGNAFAINRIDKQTELDSNNDNENDQYEELREGLMFHNWNHAVNEVDKCTIVCEHFGRPESTKSKDSNKETTSKHIECTWQINLLCPKRNNSNKIVYVAKLVNEYKNHKLDFARYNFHDNIAFTTEMIEDVEFFVKKMNCNSQQICRAIEEKYFVKVYMQVLIPIIQQFCSKLHDQTNDASRLYEELLSKKDADPQWYVQLIFCDIVLNNNTSATNHYEMTLSLFLVVDNHLSSQLVVQALKDNKTKEAHIWILQQIKKAMSGAIPQFHIAQNISLNLKNTLKDRYNNFIKDFFEVQRTKSWAKAFVLKLFTAGMSSTSRVESYNSKVKRLLFNSNTMLLELSEKLTACILEEDKKMKYALFRASVPKMVLVMTADTILPNVCKILRKYLTVEILKIQEDQIKQLLQYHAILVGHNEMQRYLQVKN
ncbi:44902_t:CDS:2 [Gigaspora margarita]|uniref:44902_t:CDS:1 n=1 Tax=Gigaspora margarita TaxID=4874 RepID=A0ABN7VTX4_GIGMA|nr:44902_t:CDS:2 [Gigaspora margarita]